MAKVIKKLVLPDKSEDPHEKDPKNALEAAFDDFGLIVLEEDDDE